MGRLLYALAASAALSAQLAAAPAWAAQPRAVVQGDMAPELRAAILRAIGETDRPVDNRFEARRRATAAAEDAIAVLRSEGFYAYDVEPDVGEGVTARCEVTLDEEIVRVVPTPRRAFQGWRYLDLKDAPADLASAVFGDVPPELARQLREVGAW